MLQARSMNELPTAKDGLKHVTEHSMAPASTRVRRSRAERVFVVATSALFLALCIGSIRTESITTNEVTHIPAGLSYLQRHDGRDNLEHPPLIKIIAALPLLFLNVRTDYKDPTWRLAVQDEYLFGKKFFEVWNTNPGTLLFLARLPMVLLTLLLGLSLYEMSRRLAGPWAGALTLTLFATSPFFIAYGSLVLTDVPLVLFSVWTMWYFASLWQEPTTRNAFLFAASLAGALLTKFSAVFLLPTILICWAWFRLSRKRPSAVGASLPVAHKRFGRERLAIGGLLLAGLIVYLFYLGILYQSSPRSILQDEATSLYVNARPVILLYRPISIMTKHPVLEATLLPAWLYLVGLSNVAGWASRPMYFLGHWHPHGVWFYFPVISFFKLAPGIVLLGLVLVAMATAHFLRNRGKELSLVPDSHRFHLRAMLATLVVFAAIAMASKLNVGIRHFSVPIGVFTLLCGLVIPLTRSVLGRRSQRLALGVIVALAFSSAMTALLAYPHYISYYNVFRMNVPKQEIAINANLSWGQSMGELNAFFKEHHVSAPYVDTGNSILDPSVYIPGAHAWQCDKPDPIAPEWVAVPAHNLVRQPPTCKQLQRYPSWTIGDGTITVFRITDSSYAEDLKKVKNGPQASDLSDTGGGGE
jgi:hypothetical protein